MYLSLNLNPSNTKLSYWVASLILIPMIILGIFLLVLLMFNFQPLRREEN